MEELELTVAEAVKMLNWQRSTVYYWMTNRKFKTIQRETSTKILITPEQLERLRKPPKSEKVKTFQEDLKQSENIQNITNENITESYKHFQNNTTPEQVELLSTALETIKQMHQSSLQNYAYNVKLLTDGRNNIENEVFELKAEKKAVEECLKKSEKEFQEKLEKSKLEHFEQLEKMKKSSNIKNYTIMFLTFLILFILVENYQNFINVEKFKTVQPVEEQVINDKKPAEVQEVVTPQAPQQAKKVVPIKRK